MLREKPITEEAKRKYQARMNLNFDRKHDFRVPQIQEGVQILVQAGFAGKKPVVLGPYRVIKVKRMSGFPKTVAYEDEEKKTQTAAIKNVLRYHQRDH